MTPIRNFASLLVTIKAIVVVATTAVLIAGNARAGPIRA